MTREAQLEWERRNGRYAAGAALGAITLEIVAFAIQISLPRPDRDGPDRYRETLIIVQDHAGAILASSVTKAIAVAFATGALFYLFMATRPRRPELPGFLRWLLVIAPVLVLAGGVVNQSNLKDLSDRYTQSGEQTRLKAAPTEKDRAMALRQCSRQRGDTPASRRAFARRYPKGQDQCLSARARRAKIDREDQAAEDLIRDEGSVLGASLGFAGTLAFALAIVMVSLNAMRAGLLSRFLGILGIITGALMVLPLLGGAPVVQLFWFGALALIFLDRWPGGRGPAWESGEADPWPTAAARRGLLPGAEEPEPEAEPAEEQPLPHPASRKKKKRKKRR